MFQGIKHLGNLLTMLEERTSARMLPAEGLGGADIAEQTFRQATSIAQYSTTIFQYSTTNFQYSWSICLKYLTFTCVRARTFILYDGNAIIYWKGKGNVIGVFSFTSWMRGSKSVSNRSMFWSRNASLSAIHFFRVAISSA